MAAKENKRKTAPSSPINSIAVLPFVNMSADPDNEYFSDGMTEEIINALTKVKGLSVIARTSSFAFKGKNIDVRTIGRQLGVRTILEGSVRRIKTKVRITAQLASTADGAHIWSKNFDREIKDIFALQDEISLLIADQIRENFGHFEIQDHLVEAPTQNIEAYQHYLKGRYHQLKWNAEDFKIGVSFFEQSIALDPSFALPYFGAALCYSLMASWAFMSFEEGMRMSEKLLVKGLQVDHQSYLGFFAQATASFWGKWDFKTGHHFLLKTMSLNPSFTDAEEGLAEIYTATGDFEKALQHARNILILNPLSPNHYYTLGNIYYLSQSYEKAIEHLEKSIQIDPGFSLAIELIAACYIHLKDYKKLDNFLLSHPNAEKPNVCRALYQLIHSDEKINVDLEVIRSDLKKDLRSSLIPWHLHIHIYLGNHDLALTILEQGIKKRIGQFMNFKSEPFFAPLHKYEQFQELIQETFHSSKLPGVEVEDATHSTANKSVYSKKEIAFHLNAITNILEKQQLFLDPNFSLKKLAEQLDLHPNKLSWLINENIGKNFNEYINSYRLATFKVKALDPANSHLTLLGLAYESGFNSKTVFNAFFKKHEGMTPRAWVKAASNKIK